MKKVIFVLLCIALLVIMVGCKQESNGFLLSDVIAEQEKNIQLYEYQKRDSSVYFLTDQTLAEKLLQKLDGIKAKPAEDWSSDLVTLPIYSFLIWQEGNKEEYSAHLVYGYWSNGYWIEPDGTAYEYKMSPENLKTDFFYKEESKKFSNICLAGTIRTLVTDENGWKKDFLSKAEPAGIIPELMTEAVVREDGLVVFIENQGKSMYFGDKYNYVIEVYLDESWYDIPRDEWERFHKGDVPGVAPGQKSEIEYSFSMYKNLPAGTYRLVTGQGEERRSLVEFQIP